LGPGDIVGARKNQLAGKAIKETSIAFSEQLFSYCRCAKIKTLAISSNSRTDRLQTDNLTIENRPKPLRGRSGVAFHLSLILYGIYLAERARRFRPDIAIIDSGTTHYFVLFLFRLLGIPVVINLHNVLWPVGFPPRDFISRGIRLLNRLFLRHAAAGAIGVSPECERQILAESENRIAFFQYRCQFYTEGFRRAKPYKGGPFRVAFVGRAEENKGLIDITRMAAELKARAPVKVIFHICGDGPALPMLARMVEENRLHDFIVIHGRLERKALLEIYSSSNAVVVPTRSTFTEGMPQVCAEAVLSGLPVITSQVANAFDVIGSATIRAETDNVETYVGAILSLIERPSLHCTLRSECEQLSLQFLDRTKSYPAAVDRLIAHIFQITPLSDYRQLFNHETE
jgi:glycogen(starch) synthase